MTSGRRHRTWSATISRRLSATLRAPRSSFPERLRRICPRSHLPTPVSTRRASTHPAFDTDDPWNDAETAQADEGEFQEFFSEDKPAEPGATQPKTAKPAKKSGGGYTTKIALLAGLIVVLGGAALFLTVLQGDNSNDTEMPGLGDSGDSNVPDEDRTVEAAPELGPLSALNGGTAAEYRSYIEEATAAVGAGGAADARAQLVIAQALLFTETPEDPDLRTAMEQQFAALESAEPSTLVQLARGAYLASIGDERAMTILALLANGEYGAYAQLFSGLQGIQAYRGVATAEALVADGSGEAPVAPIGDQPSATLEDSIARSLDAAIEAAPSLVSARYWRGWVALQQGDPEAARPLFEQAASLNEAHVRSRVGVASSALRSGSIGEASEMLNELHEATADTASARELGEILVEMARVELAMIDPGSALLFLQQALQNDPQNSDAIRLLGETWYEMDAHHEAIDFYQNTATLSRDNPETALLLVRGWVGLEDWTEARSEIDSARSAFPNDGRFPYYLGLVNEGEADFERARELYREALQIDPGFLRPQLRLAELAMLEGRTTEAIDLIEDAIAGPASDASTYTDMGDLLLELGQTNEAINVYRRALEVDRSYPYARLALVQHYLNTDQPERALGELDEMADSGVQSDRVPYLRAKAYLRLELYDRGIEVMIELLDDENDQTVEYAEYLHLMGRMQFGAGNPQSAREYFTRAYDLSPSRLDSLYWQGRCDIELGSYSEAITSITTVASNTRAGEHYFWLGYALEQSDQPTEALQDYTRAVDSDMAWSLANPDVFYRRGRLYYMRGVNSSAYRDLRVVLTLNPRHSSAARVMGRVHFEDRDFDRSIALLEQSLAIEPENPETNYYLGIAHLNRDAESDAIALPYLETAPRRRVRGPSPRAVPPAWLRVQ